MAATIMAAQTMVRAIARSERKIMDTPDPARERAPACERYPDAAMRESGAPTRVSGDDRGQTIARTPGIVRR
jgi:hypothetical protein